MYWLHVQDVYKDQYKKSRIFSQNIKKEKRNILQGNIHIITICDIRATVPPVRTLKKKSIKKTRKSHKFGILHLNIISAISEDSPIPKKGQHVP